MAGTIVGVFDTRQAAERAARALLAVGATFNDITLVRKDAGGETGSPENDGDLPMKQHEEFLSHNLREVAVHDIEQDVNPFAEVIPRATVGIVIGCSLGVLIAATTIVHPNLSVMMEHYALAALMTGGIAGAAIGALIGAFTSGGVPREAATRYHNFVERGNTLLTILTSKANVSQFDDVMTRNGAHDVAFLQIEDTIQSIES